MNMMKKNIYIILSLLGVLLIFFLLVNSRRDILHEKKFTNYLFVGQDYGFDRECYDDLLGLTIDGSVYEFYKYQIEGFNKLDVKINYPRYDSVFNNKSMVDAKYSYWKSTPLQENESQFYLDIANSTNLTESQCASKFLQKKYLTTTGNYYTYFSNYSLGTYLFILSPLENKLYLIFKKG